MEESKSDSSQVREAHGIIKSHSQQQPPPFEPPYPASLVEFPLAPDLPVIVNAFYYMLRYRSRTVLAFCLVPKQESKLKWRRKQMIRFMGLVHILRRGSIL